MSMMVNITKTLIVCATLFILAVPAMAGKGMSNQGTGENGSDQSGQEQALATGTQANFHLNEFLVGQLSDRCIRRFNQGGT